MIEWQTDWCDCCPVFNRIEAADPRKGVRLFGKVFICFECLEELIRLRTI